MKKKKVDKQLEMKNFNMLTHFTVKDMPNGDTENEIIKIAGTANFMGAVDDQGYGSYMDLANEVVQIPGIDVKTWKANPIILFGHDRDKPIGKGTKIEKQKDRLYVECEIHKGACDDEVFYAIKNGILSTFSIGFKSLSCDYREVNGMMIRYIMKSLLCEISVVSVPCNSASSFQVTKAYGEDGFYVEGEEDKDDYHGEVNIDEEDSSTKGETMKVKMRSLLDADKIKELEALGLQEALEVEQEVSVKDYLDSLIEKAMAGKGSMAEKMKATMKAMMEEMMHGMLDEMGAGHSGKQAEGTEEKTEEDKAAEAEALAAKEDLETGTEVKSLADAIAELKKLAEEA